MFRRLRDRVQRNQRGVIMVWMLVFILIMIAFVALGLDGAKLMATRSQLQNAADAAALAGASAVDPLTGKLVEVEAKTRAHETGLENHAYEANGTPVDLDVANDVTVDIPNGNVHVVARRNGAHGMVTQLLQVVGLPKLNISASATAHVDVPDSVCKKMRPFGAGFDSSFVFNPGQEYTLSDVRNSGNYQFLDFPPCPDSHCPGGGGADEYRCLVENGYECCIGKGQDIPVKPGAMAGPTAQGINRLFDLDTIDDEYGPSLNNAYSVYKASGGNDSRVIYVPLCTWYDLPGGNAYAHVNGFAAFFLKRRYTNGQKTFYGEFIDHVAPGKGSSGSGTAMSVKLIQ